MSKKKTHEEFVEEVKDTIGNDYIFLTEYKDKRSPIKLKHRCGFEFEMYPRDIYKSQTDLCPVCNPYRKQDINTVKERFRRIYGDEYSLIGDYNPKNPRMKIRHNVCKHPEGFYIWETNVRDFINDHRKCRYCSNYIDNGKIHFDDPYNITKEDVVKRLQQLNLNVTLIGEYKSKNDKLHLRCNACNYEFYVIPHAVWNFDSKRSTICPRCNHANNNSLGSRVYAGINDIKTTNPEIYNILLNKDDGLKYAKCSTVQLDFKCPDCGKIFKKLPYLVFNKFNEITCPFCKDGYSFPEKLFNQLLLSLGVKYNYQASSSIFNWCKKYRYDFYIPKENMIIEVNGSQHYVDTQWSTCKEVLENDIAKRNLALNNGIENYVVIDARESTLEYIRASVLSSELPSFFDFSKIDWEKCCKMATTSKMIEVCQLWDQEYDTYATLAEKMGITKTTVRKYLIDGAAIGLCDFDVKAYRKRISHEVGIKNSKALGKPVYCHELNTVYSSIKVAERAGFSHVQKVLNDKARTSGGYHWSRVSCLDKIILEQKNPVYIGS